MRKELQTGDGSIDEILEGIPAEGIHCHEHKDINAYSTCSDCGRGICRDCMSSTKDSWRLLCRSCTAKRRKITLSQMLTTLKYPVLWVLLCLFIASSAYVAGFGNPSIKRFIKEDATLPWFRQRAGKLYLAQAIRERSRADVLNAEGDTKEAQKWFGMSAEAFELSAGAWRDTPAVKPLGIAMAQMLISSGAPAKAIEKLLSLGIAPESNFYCPLQFQLGLAYEATGDKEKALEHFKTALSHFKEEKASFDLDSMIVLAGKDSTEENNLKTISMACGTDVPHDEIARKCGIRPAGKEQVDNPRKDKETPAKNEETNEDDDSDFNIEILKPKGK